MRRSSVKTLVKSEELNVKQTSAVSDQSPVSMREFQKLSSGGTPHLHSEQVLGSGSHHWLLLTSFWEKKALISMRSILDKLDNEQVIRYDCCALAPCAL